MRKLKNLELHVTHACNLTCESCSHYSNQGHKGLLTLEDAERWMEPWSRRLRPKTFSLLGGEPTIHPQLTDFIPLTRRLWPHSEIRLVTNGFFLHRHPQLPAALKAAGKARLYLSIHHNSPEYLEKLQPVFDLIKQWKREHRIKVTYYKSWKYWTRRYHGEGKDMMPYEDGNPRSSWKHCPAKYCPQIHEGKIYKCAALAFLPMQQSKYGLSEKWSQYLQYEPLSPESDKAELESFFNRKEESHCGMCPAKPERFKLVMPLAVVNR